jgi:TetR/AcrR family transcriptional repressor of bet genes
MPKVGMEPIRRAETINATLECICEVGIDKITLDMVAAKAGFSKGIVAYYFKTKKQLVIESLKEFLAAYKLKIGSLITKDLQPLQMINTIVEVALPRIDIENNEPINVSTFLGNATICLPQGKIAKIFVQFISKAANDEDLRNILKNIYTEDIEGISVLMGFAKKMYHIEGLNETKNAYTLFAIIYGLSFFRSINFMLSGENDNRDIAFEFISRLFRQDDLQQSNGKSKKFRNEDT